MSLGVRALWRRLHSRGSFSSASTPPAISAIVVCESFSASASTAGAVAAQNRKDMGAEHDAGRSCKAERFQARVTRCAERRRGCRYDY